MKHPKNMKLNEMHFKALSVLPNFTGSIEMGKTALPQLASAFFPFIQTSFSFAFITNHSWIAHAYKVPQISPLKTIYIILKEGPHAVYDGITVSQMISCPKQENIIYIFQFEKKKDTFKYA